MSTLIKEALKSAAEKAVYEFLFESPTNVYNSERPVCIVKKRRAAKMSWLDFSDNELRIVNEVEKTPGMSGKQIVVIMEAFDAEYPEGQCGEGFTKFLLSNLVGRKVLINKSNDGYHLNDSDIPPSPIASKLPS